MKQHAKTVDHSVPACTGLGKKRRLERHIDQIADQGMLRQGLQADVERGLTVHTLIGGIYEQCRPLQGVVSPRPIVNMHLGAVNLGQLLGFVLGSVHQANLVYPLIEQRAHHCPGCTPAPSTTAGPSAACQWGRSSRRL